MKILVCITHVPDTTSKISFSVDGTTLNKDGLQFIIGPYDDYALAKGVELKEQSDSSLTVLNVGTSESDTTIRKALAIGADDAIRIDMEPTDSLSVAKEIAHVIKENGYDLVLMGRESIDYNNGIVHALVGEMVGYACASPVMKLNVDGENVHFTVEIEGGTEDHEAMLPLVAGCQEPIAEWKIPNMRGIMTARSKPLNVIAPQSEGSSIKTLNYELPKERSGCKMIEADNAGELIELLHSDSKVI